MGLLLQVEQHGYHSFPRCFQLAAAVGSRKTQPLVQKHLHDSESWLARGKINVNKCESACGRLVCLWLWDSHNPVWGKRHVAVVSVCSFVFFNEYACPPLFVLGRRALGAVSVEGRWDHVRLDPGEESCPGGTVPAGVKQQSVTHEHMRFNLCLLLLQLLTEEQILPAPDSSPHQILQGYSILPENNFKNVQTWFWQKRRYPDFESVLPCHTPTSLTAMPTRDFI